MSDPEPILTIGHSTRPIDAFLDLLTAHGVEQVIDVRTAPGSRRFPQFNRDQLEKSLASRGIGYVHMKGLGGFRKARPDSPNAGWKNASFRGYADYMQTPEFERELSDLIARTAQKRSAIMCCEATPWRCHRSLIADALTVRNVPVEHIMTAARRDPHRSTRFAKVEGTRLTYPPEQGVLGAEE